MSQDGIDDTNRAGIACVGNWILDVVHTIPAWPEQSDLVQITAQRTGLGGGAANVASDLVAMGARYPVLPVGLVGAGALGDEVIRLCTLAGLPVERIARTAEATTAQTHVMNVPGQSRTFFYYPGANDLLDASRIDVAGLANAGVRMLYYGYLNLLARLDRIGADGRTGAAALLAEARTRGMATCVDLASSQGAEYRRIVEATLPEIDYLFLNELEAGRATSQAIANEADTDGMVAAAKALKAGGARRAVIVHSPARIVWLGEEAPQVFTPEPVPPDRIVSAVGAGDAFAAGVLHALHEGWPAARCVELGCNAATACLAGQTATDGLQGVSLL